MKVNSKHIIRIKKRVASHDSHHTGSWKIAYADFMTAMMAFFLVMWLISISSPQELTQIAEYFRTPLRTAMNNGNKSGDVTNPIPGGGKDIILNEGDNLSVPNNQINEKNNSNLEKLKHALNRMILSNNHLNQLKPHLLIDIINEGLRIQIIDSKNRPMFTVGSAQIEPYMRDILHSIAPFLNDVPNRISISGHTDDLPYINEKNYSNWELSMDRANASRRELITGGLNHQKIFKIIGMASTIHLNKNDGLSPTNRRISIIVLNDTEVERMLNQYNDKN